MAIVALSLAKAEWWGLPLMVAILSGPLLFTLWEYLARPLYILAALPEIRRACGLCIHCGYDLRASSHRCPECGHEFTARENHSR